MTSSSLSLDVSVTAVIINDVISMNEVFIVAASDLVVADDDDDDRCVYNEDRVGCITAHPVTTRTPLQVQSPR